MKFSIRVLYGLQALIELALNYGGGPVQIKDIAASQKIPIRFLEQILLVLKRGGLVSSARGKSGGYLLAKRPSEISVLGLVELLDGAIELTNKKMKRSAVLYETFEQLQGKIRDELAGITLDDLTLRKRQKDRAYTYNI